ncbi:hypothetical protein DY023_15720 [Microbacterium bovistercoris]|uniref:Uncharacterized protein n=1 Tax=Microbacterium bovistercoris TaxID=2293570 RepID=A0A371NQ99_9MICO|nr:hypothetical protein [Microbacterium bovistercoris]REJ04346.1 hypothetical protein DY023_15720 [Microbacterium bovistercoris]
MVAHVLRLRLALLAGSLRTGHPVRTVAGLLAVAALTVATCVAVLSLSDGTLQTARSVIVLGGAAVFLAFLLGPVLVGTSDQLDPRKFAVFGVDERRMPWMLALASVISIPSAALIAVGVCVMIVGIGFGAPWPVAVLSTLLGVAVAIVAARIGMAVSALLLPERRSRELTALFALALIVIAFPVAVFFASMAWDGAVPQAVATATSIIGVTPLGAAQGFLFSVADGDIAAAWLSAIVGVLTAAGAAVLWEWLVRRLLTTVERPVAARERSGLGWFAVLPSNAFGAVAARSLVYWLRDRRYIVNVIVVPIAGILTVLPLVVAGVPVAIAALIPAPLIALFLGWLPHNDVAYDSTAIWVHIASGMKGVADRLGRLVPMVLLALPLLAVAVSITLAVVGDWSLLMPFTGVVACLFLSALGMSSLSSVIAPYAVSRPGDSPFQQPQRSASYGSYGAALSLLAALVLTIPAGWLFVLTLLEGDRHGPATFWTGIIVGVLALAAGVSLGGRIFEHSGERLMEFAETT